MSKGTGDIPFGSEFSPSQLDLREVLTLTAAYSGNIPGLEAVILAKWFTMKGGPDPAKADKNRRTLAMNSRLGLQAYGLLDDAGRPTVLADALSKIAKDDDLYAAFAQHILLNLNGMRIVECVRDMTAAGDLITHENLEAALRLRGMKVAKISRGLPSLRLWLEKAGIFSGGIWQIDALRLQQVLGTDPDAFTALADLSPGQRAFLRALASTGKTEPQLADGIKNLAESVYGIPIPGKSFSGNIIKALQDKGWVVAAKSTAGRGGGRTNTLVKPTSRVATELIEPFLKQLQHAVDAKLLALLRKPMAEVLREIEATDTYVAGLALEALAFKLMRLLDIDYVDTRLRGIQTGGAEVDLIFESVRLVFSRWQVQCKRVKTGVSVDDVAKEVGLTHVLKSNVIVVVTTGPVGGEARKYSNQIMRQTNLAIVLIDGRDLAVINDDPTRIVAVFRREAEQAMRLKALTKDEVPSQ